MRKYMVQTGFTLIEMMVTIAIVGILTTIAMPNYTDYLKRGKAAEATSNLANLRVRMEQSYQDNRFYTCPAPLVSGVASKLPGDKYFTTLCALAAGASPQTYTLTATGDAALNMGGFSFTVDQANAKTSTFDGVTPTSNTCWLTNKNGQC